MLTRLTIKDIYVTMYTYYTIHTSIHTTMHIRITHHIRLTIDIIVSCYVYTIHIQYYTLQAYNILYSVDIHKMTNAHM
jgi:hypothetical protein